jgi:RTX calcium-binding nonapeptide repeat (4 copies)
VIVGESGNDILRGDSGHDILRGGGATTASTVATGTTT